MTDLPGCEVSLHAQVSLRRHEQVLGILAGLAAMQPQLHYTRHLIFAPIASQIETDDQQAFKKKPTKSSAQRPPTYVQLVTPLADAAFGAPAPTNSQSIPVPDSVWTVRVQQTPDPEFKDPIVRRIDEQTPSPDLVSSLFDATQHRFVTEYITEAQRIVFHDVVVSLDRILSYKHEPGHPRQDIAPLSELKLLDPSGGFLVAATVRVEDRTKPALVQAASEQLNAVRAELKDVISLRAPERLSMDSRVKAVRV